MEGFQVIKVKFTVRVSFGHHLGKLERVIDVALSPFLRFLSSHGFLKDVFQVLGELFETLPPLVIYDSDHLLEVQ